MRIQFRKDQFEQRSYRYYTKAKIIFYQVGAKGEVRGFYLLCVVLRVNGIILLGKREKSVRAWIAQNTMDIRRSSVLGCLSLLILGCSY